MPSNAMFFMDKRAKCFWAALTTIIIGAVWLISQRAYLPHVDDFYIISWAKTLADQAALPVYALSRFYPEPEYFHYAPRLHIETLALWVKAFGVSLPSLLAFRTTMFVLTAAIISVAALKRKLPLLAVFFPVILCVTMLHTGQRPESTALLLFVAGFALLWNEPAGAGIAPSLNRILAKSLVIVAPLFWPSALGYGAGLIVATDLRDMRIRPIAAVVSESVIAGAIGVFVLGAMVDFDYLQFFRVYSSYAAEHDDVLSFSFGRLVEGAVLIAAGYAVRNASPYAAFAGLAIGLGEIFGIVLHSKISISTPLTALAVLALADAASQSARLRFSVWALAVAASAALAFNQAMFLVRTHVDKSAQVAVRAFADKARAEGRPLLVDEIGATYGLALDIDGVLSWSFSELHPGNRPQSIDAIREGESWIVSAYTIHSWLKSQVVSGFPGLRDNETDRMLRGLPCLLGRNSCRFPRTRWTYYLVERRDGKVSLQTVP